MATSSSSSMIMNQRWKFDLSSVPSRITKVKALPKPIGFDADTDADGTVVQAAVITADKELAAKQKQAMAIAYGPGKNLLSTGFMLWMSGSSIQIFSIMMTGMALINPLKALTTVSTVFKPFERDGVDTKIPKVIFIVLQLLSLAVALYKCSSMGLLPLTSADWMGNIPVQRFVENAPTPL